MKFYLQEICSSTCVAGTELLKEPASSGETTSWYAGGAEAAILVDKGEVTEKPFELDAGQDDLKSAVF